MPKCIECGKECSQNEDGYVRIQNRSRPDEYKYFCTTAHLTAHLHQEGRFQLAAHKPNGEPPLNYKLPRAYDLRSS